MTATLDRPTPSAPTPPDPRQSRHRRSITPPVGGRIGSTALWTYAIIALIPLLLMVWNSFRTNRDLVTNPLGAPFPPNASSYRTAWTDGSMAQYFVNSVIITVGAVLLSTVVATMASYALARSRSKVIRVIEGLFLSGLMMPIHLAILPIFYLFDSLGLINSLFGLVLLYGASGVPFSIFVLSTFFRQLPAELEEAAQIDGANAWQTFVKIMLPLVRPAVVTVAVFRFVPIWNDFLFPLVLLRDSDKYPLPVGLTSFFAENSANYSAIFAGLVITTLPLIVLFLLATKQIVAGLTAGMSK
ncbi:carbohydrate ABC transporter permease [Nakamurella sp. A5-74]|uniref:Carbohydrate ABC transporter permease n=1 Tax=Nakamurella sp. A5-74 TaxID=3158264 RepID=A0AAU8DVE4_9ACTN